MEDAGRRAFLRRLVPGLAPAEEPDRAPRRLVLEVAKLDARRLRTTRLTERRERLLAALERHPGRPARAATASVGFASSKQVDPQTCTACMQCVTACPSGALGTSLVKDQLTFEASRCLKCGLCHDVCEPRAITLAPEFDAAAFAARRREQLVRLDVRSCGECGAIYKADGDRTLCGRCRELDDEARALTRRA